MIKIMPESQGKLLAVTATGTLTDNDYVDVWIPALQEVIDEYEVVNALLYMDDEFEGWDLKAMWEDAKFGLKHRNDFAKIAVVGGPDWIKWGVKIGDLLLDCVVKTYTPDKLQEALAWAAESPGCACND